MKIYFHILLFILLLYFINASHDENRRNRQHRRNRAGNHNPVSAFSVFTGQASRQDTFNYVLGRHNRDSDTNSVSPWSVFTGQASRQDTQNYALGNYAPTNQRPNRNRNNQHEVVDGHSTTAEFGDTTDQNLLDNFNSFTIDDIENNSYATHNPGDYTHNAETSQNVPRGQHGRRSHRRNNHPGMEGAFIYNVPTPPREGMVQLPDGNFVYASNYRPRGI
uniref:Uncharacterized protein n=1 Tax=Meloidogyne enterolobii TaxID=390850 RepID=A0A6V7WJK4_MELEN|nr:unnamed protein product [Meloidogyne enterolobii]